MLNGGPDRYHEGRRASAIIASGGERFPAKSFGSVGEFPDQSAAPLLAGSKWVGGVFHWKEVDLQRQATQKGWLETIRPLWENTTDRCLEQHVTWIRFLNHQDGSRGHLFELRDQSGLCGYAVLQAGPTVLIWDVRGVPLFRRSIQQVRFVHDIIVSEEFGQERAAAARADLIVLLGARFPGWPIFLEAFQSESVEQVLADRRVRSRFLIFRRGPEHLHCALDIPSSMDEYLRIVGPKMRQTIRRTARRLNEHCADDVYLTTYRGPGEVGRFLEAAVAIASTTYQYKVYKWGIAAEQNLRADISQWLWRAGGRAICSIAKANLWRS